MNWHILQLDVTTEGDLTDVVIIAHWTLTKAQNGYFGSTYGSVKLPAPSDDFTPYEDLTEDMVLGWIWANGVDKDEVEAQVLAQIEDQKNPTVTTPPLPWQEAQPQTEEV